MPDIGPIEISVLLMPVAILVLVVVLIVRSQGGKNPPPSRPVSSGASTPAGSEPPAGWYPDTDVTGGQRWWNGHAWTETRLPPGS